ncbi:hypothetical protein DSCA_34790 [Desulfosarcina alkanivorans]|jgi:hypothetical protein|uniref:Uncharacterized protein n=1 Tax=Desulfosarcina alkanivorans TaxID=571177 RepID=A0A5K7YNV0_9BACT|nr:hypothetical protein DSCA_34790 [Desulfosarcina alkanivorans]
MAWQAAWNRRASVRGREARVFCYFTFAVRDIAIWLHMHLRKRTGFIDPFQIVFDVSPICFLTRIIRTAVRWMG